MKCKYNHCKLGGEVNKDIATKVNKNYYHKECYRDKRLRKRIHYLLKNRYKVPDKHTMLLKRINDYCEQFELKYILFVLSRKLNLKYVNGLKYFLENDTYKKAYNKVLSAKELRKKVIIKTIDYPIFEIKFKQNEMWGDELWKCHSIPIVKQE